MIRLHRKWNLVVLALLLTGTGGWLWYRNTPARKVDRLLVEMRRLGPRIAGHSGGRTRTDAFDDLVAERTLASVLRDLASGDPSARFYAAWALEEIGPVTPAAQAALEEVRQDRPRRSTG